LAVISQPTHPPTLHISQQIRSALKENTWRKKREENIKNKMHSKTMKAAKAANASISSLGIVPMK